MKWENKNNEKKSLKQIKIVINYEFIINCIVTIH